MCVRDGLIKVGFNLVMRLEVQIYTDNCKAAHLNGTLYIYGGQAKRTKDQTTDTWSKPPTSSVTGFA